MSYEKLGFENGQVLKAEHLNHMEEGIFANTIPVYKEEDITLEKAVELAKNKTIFWIEKINTNENYEGKATLSINKKMINGYTYNHAQREDMGCGDYEDVPAQLKLFYLYNPSSTHTLFKTFEITDEIVDEIRAAWGL